MIADSRVILALNSGSSSLKIGCYTREDGEERLLLSGSAEGIGRGEGSLHLRTAAGTVLVNEDHVSESQEQALDRIGAALQDPLHGPPAAVGHRVVHGGPKLRTHQRITPEVIAELEAVQHLAPLHIPAALALIRKTEQMYPEVPQIACFDTTFHRTMPDVATHLPLPARYFEQGVQRYGFHGLSCESVMRRLGATAPARMAIAHLGNGSSVTAVRNGESVDTTMSLSPTGGVPMGTRSGDLDPGVLLYLLRTEGLSVDALERLVNHECGLAGLSGGESDMQALLLRAGAGDGAARLAVDVFCTDVRKSLGAYAALLGGLELVVFTGGIGEHSAAVRERILDGLHCLATHGDRLLTRVMPAQEELEIATHCRELLAG